MSRTFQHRRKNRRYQTIHWPNWDKPFLIRCDKCNTILASVVFSSSEQYARGKFKADIERHENEAHPNEVCPPINTCWQVSVPAARKAPKKAIRNREYAASEMEKALRGDSR